MADRPDRQSARDPAGDAMGRALRAALRGEPGARVAYARAERAWALDVLAGIMRGAGDARPAGDAPGAGARP